MKPISEKVLVVVYSYHHMNTEKIADVIACILGAEVKRPRDILPETITDYGLIGFGAGIDSGKHYKPMLEFASALPAAAGRKAFIFSTAGVTGEKKITRDHKALREKLLSKGYEIIGEFGCKGFNTNSVLKLFGGMNKGRPNAEDLKAAAAFAHVLKERTGNV